MTKAAAGEDLDASRRRRTPDLGGRSVTFVLPGYAPHPVGGVRVVLQYANFLAERGAEVTVLSSRRFLRQTPKAWPSLPLAREAWSWLRERTRAAIGRPVPWFAVHPKVRVVPSTGLPDHVPRTGEIVVATAVDTAFWVAELTRRHGVPGAYFIQHYEDWAAPKEFVDATWRLGLHNIVVADWLSDIGSQLDVPASLVGNGYDLTGFPLGPPPSERRASVLAMVSDVPFKRTDLTCQVFSRLLAERPGIFAATFGVCERPTALPPQVQHFREPSRARLSELYRDARVFFSTSDSEGFGLPVAEALMSGALCVSTDSGGVRSVAGHEVEVVGRGDVDEVVARILTLLDEPPEAADARARAARERLARYGLGDAAERFVATLLESSTQLREVTSR
ncbi:glycosyltransferase family 4 protein [Microbacterium sp. NPDC016588]